MPIPDVTNMKVADLKRELKIRGLPTTGNKNELQERLQTVMEVEPLLEESGISGEELLDEDAVLSDEEEAKILNEHELLKSPLTTPSTTELMKDDNNGNNDLKDDVLIEDDLLESPTKISATAITSKKIVLKRKNSQTILPSIATDPNNKSLIVGLNTTKENAEPSSVDIGKKSKMSERNPIKLENNSKQEFFKNAAESKNIKKLSQLSVQERLEMRAKKFGIDISTKNQLTKNTSFTDNNLSVTINDTKQIEILKKRAERFGCVTSKNLAQLDAQERLLKRKQRFGDDASIKKSGKTTAPASSNDWAEKARKRLERFKVDPGNANKNTNSATIVSN